MSNKIFPLLMVGSFLSGKVFTRSVGEELSLRLRLRGWPVLITSHQANRFLRLADMLVTVIIKQKQYTAAYLEVYSGWAFIWAEWIGALLRGLRKPYILTLHGGGLVDFAQKNPGRVRRLLHKARAVTSPSQWITRELSIYRPDIEYLPNAIEIENYQFRLRSHPAPKLVWLRAFHQIYQPWMALEAFALVKKDYPDAELLMIGPDKHDGSLENFKAMLDTLGLQNGVIIAGGVPKSEVPAWLNRGDIFLNTTIFESFGVSVLEAAACGLPIVTTNAGELPFLWAQNEEALLVPVNSAVEMAAAVRRILSEPGLAAKLSANAREKANRFDWTVVLPQWEQLIKRAATSA